MNTSPDREEPLRQATSIAASLSAAADAWPHQIAVAEPHRRRRRPLPYHTITFAELDRLATAIAAGVRQTGVEPGMRISLMVPPGIDFVAWVWGLLRAGAVTVLIDPGMGRSNMIRCLRETSPAGLAGVWQAQLARWLFRSSLPECRFNFLVGRGIGLGAIRTRGWSLSTPTTSPPGSPSEASAEDPAAIIFTTGSTGPPKGVLYRHRHFLEQTIRIREGLRIEPGGVDVSGFPLFALFNAGMGTTTVFPRMDPTRPARVDPLDVADAVQQFQANQSFGSPALWNRVAKWGEANGLRLPTLRRVLTAGAPVPAHVLQRVRKLIADDGEVHTPYGATEALPVASIESREVLGETAALTAMGQGTCVGCAWSGIRWRVIAISDGPLPRIEQACALPTGEIGELIVSGPVVTDLYVTRTDANALQKIADGEGFWHRMGDVGYLDDRDRFWFCGRKNHRVRTANGTLFTICCEAIFNQHPQVFRSALVGVGLPGQQIPVIIVEPEPGHFPHGRAASTRLFDELRVLGQASPLTATISRFLVRKQLPVDIRHNAKIFREQLAVWAAKRFPGS
jgi:olefin beta-lactone synthetase